MIRLVIAAFALMTLGLAQAGAASVSYFPVPSGAHPHDVAPAPDGTVWYTAQQQGALGLLDPKTGKTMQIPLGPDSAPHGVIVGPDRAAWVTDGGQNAIVRVDPQTHAVRRFPLPKGFDDANLNTATFDRKGILWFTGQNGVYGRVDPATGKVEAWKAPKGVGPYGITTTPEGEVWYASLAGDHIAKVDTVSGEAMMIAPPKPGVGPRRIWSDSKGMLWVSFWRTRRGRPFRAGGRGAGRCGGCREAPAGCYAVFVDDKDKVWVSDWEANAIRRFDPATEHFDTFVSNKAARRRAADPRPSGRALGARNPAPTGWWSSGIDLRPRHGRIGAMALRFRCQPPNRAAAWLLPAPLLLPGFSPAQAARRRIDALILMARALPPVAAAHRLHLARAHRHALSRLHLDRRPAPAGALRRARRRLRLRHLLRNRAGGRALRALERLRARTAPHPLSQRRRFLAHAQSLFRRLEHATTSPTASARGWRCPAASPSTRPSATCARWAHGGCRSTPFRARGCLPTAISS